MPQSIVFNKLSWFELCQVSHHDFSSSLVQMWELDSKESWVLKNWCFWTMVLEKTLESPLDCKEIQPVHPKKKSVLNWKDWCWSWNSNTLATWCEEATHWKRPWCWERLKEEKGTTEDETVGGHHRLDGHECEQAPGVSGGQGSLAYCNPWGCKESDTAKWLNWSLPRFGEREIDLINFDSWNMIHTRFWKYVCGLDNLPHLNKSHLLEYLFQAFLYEP